MENWKLIHPGTGRPGTGLQIRVDENGRARSVPPDLYAALLYIENTWLPENEDDSDYQYVLKWTELANAQLEEQRVACKPTQKKELANVWHKKLVKAGKTLAYCSVEELRDLLARRSRPQEFAADEWEEVMEVALDEVRSARAKKLAAKRGKQR